MGFCPRYYQDCRKEVALVNRPRRPVIRRVYVEENAVVPPWT